MEIHLNKNSEVLVKVGQEKHILDAYEKGLLYFNTISNLRLIEKQSVGDPNENIDILFQADSDYEIIIDGQKLTRETGLISGSLDLPQNMKNTPCTHVFCSYLLRVNEENIKCNKIILHDEMINFGSHGLLIHKPMEFIKRISNAIAQINDLKFGNQMFIGRIKYVDFNSYSGDISVLVKDISYKNQNEYRIAFYCNSKEPLIVNIGSMKDIATVSKFEKLDSI